MGGSSGGLSEISSLMQSLLASDSSSCSVSVGTIFFFFFFDCSYYRTAANMSFKFLNPCRGFLASFCRLSSYSSYESSYVFVQRLTSLRSWLPTQILPVLILCGSTSLPDTLSSLVGGSLGLFVAAQPARVALLSRAQSYDDITFLATLATSIELDTSDLINTIFFFLALLSF